MAYSIKWWFTVYSLQYCTGDGYMDVVCMTMYVVWSSPQLISYILDIPSMILSEPSKDSRKYDSVIPIPIHRQ